MNRWMIVVVALMSCAVCAAQDALVFEDFENVEAWPGFEISIDQAHSGETSALWRDMTKRKSVRCSDIPHDWTDYSAFTFWVYNEKKLPAAFMLIISSENPETAGADYWGIKIRLDFEGWRMFGLKLTGSGRTRSPLGWDQIQDMYFTASGWNNTPHPEAVVYIDEMRLTNEYGGPGPLLSDAEFFGLLREDIEALAPTREAAADEDYDLAGERLLAYMRARERPVHSFDWRDWDKNRNLDYNTTGADYVLAHMFRRDRREADLGPDIDWTSNGFDPSEPAYTPEWTFVLNRFTTWPTLGKAYWGTGDEKYAQEFVDQMLDWTHDQVAPNLGNPNYGPCWRSIEQGIRTAGSWMHAYHYFLGSPSMTPHAHTTFLKSFVEHGRTLKRITVDYPWRGGNWVTMECNGLAHIGVMFPEFSEAESWHKAAYAKMLKELDAQVYPDGAQMELTTGYHQVARSNFMHALAPAQRNDVEIPAEYLDKLKRMYWLNLYAMRPDGRLPPLNDSGDSAVTSSLKHAYEVWGDEEFLWGSTGGQKGTPLDFTSYFFPWAGWAIMRSGWERTDSYLMFEIGPFGTGHQHEDKLGLYLWAHGRALLNEGGTYTYDRSKWRRYVLATSSHNTIMVDGLGQHRRGLRETYRATEPMIATDCWATTEVFDWARGLYDKGYGPLTGEDGKFLSREHDLTDVQHERTVVFVRPDYYIVIDRMLGDGGEAHTYSNLFHFDADEAVVDEASMIVSSADAGKANLTLVPLATDGLTLRMVKGQEDPVQGWIPRFGLRAIPTAIYEKTGAAPELFVTLMMPHPTEDVPELSAELIADTGEMVGISVRTDEGEDIILYAFDGPMEMEAGGVAANAQLAVVRRPAAGAAVAGLLGGTEVSVEGQVIAPVAPDNQGG